MVFLQHPRERHVAIGTARMAHLALEGSALVEGVTLDDHPLVSQEMMAGGAAVLFPGEEAQPLEAWRHAPPRALFVLDGTWAQARKLLKLNPRLAALPRVGFTPAAPGNYRIRKEPSDECLATIEAVASVLGILEGDPPRYQQLLVPFDYMVDRQLEAVRASAGARARFRRRRPEPLSASWCPELSPLLQRPERAVLLYGEANAQPRDARTTGAPELLHLVAVRPATKEQFEEIMAPRRRLGDDTARHLDLPTEVLLQGAEVGPALARFRAFLESASPDGSRDTLLCAWGPYARDLLVREGEPARGFVDLRALAARAWGRTSGGIPGCAERLEATHDDVRHGDVCHGERWRGSRRHDEQSADVAPRGRARKMLTHLERIYAALMSAASSPPMHEASASDTAVLPGAASRPVT